MYPLEEQVDILFIYGECQQNSIRAKNLYAERYPYRCQFSCRTFENMCDKLRQTSHQQLQGNDFMNRVEFCRWAKHQIQNNELFFNTALFNDEATFTNRGNVNLHNMHLWAAENPHWLRRLNTRDNGQYGITGDKIIGSHFINGNLNGNIYANFIEDTLGTLLEELYQHDGCPAHYSLIARRELDEKFQNPWVRRGG
ncbi:hypothetical protein WN55_00370 [Dufourea novaeangliae]|uniref:DUF4817 domain-containing protein n=1 Tax=Dufourea novaeangliae TaxID=178035 RepID=A0A154PH28_DUFNO|nr:hypothetical protein WN55_00370 [Dufourea novaeangliae]